MPASQPFLRLPMPSKQTSARIWLGAANAVTFARAIMAPVCGYLIVTSDFDSALIAVLIAAITDMLDGRLARMAPEETSRKFGAMLDPLVDKFFLMVVFGAYSWIGLFPLWVYVVFLIRDLVIGFGALAWWRLYAEDHGFTPMPMAKVAVFIQFVLGLLLVMSQTTDFYFVPFEPTMWLALALTVGTGAHYVVSYTARAQSISAARKSA